MSTTESESHSKVTPLESHHEARQHEHPSDWLYIKVGLFLGALTALEVSTYFLEDASTTMLVVTLIPLMIIKFGVVCAFFMHLRYDNPLFKRVFVFGLALAIGVYIIVLTAMQFWDSGYGT
jgi:cytochrome c oxidase subunit IV